MSLPNPVFSHGGTTVPGFTAVVGNTTNSGRPVFLSNGVVGEIYLHGILDSPGTCTVVIEVNGGSADPQTGIPPAADWIDISSGGIALSAGSPNFAKKIPPILGYVRTRITVYGSGTFRSYIPAFRTATGDFQSASYPSIRNVQSLF